MTGDVQWPKTIGKNGPNGLARHRGATDLEVVKNAGSAKHNTTRVACTHTAPAERTASLRRASFIVRKPGCVTHAYPSSSKLRHGWRWRMHYLYRQKEKVLPINHMVQSDLKEVKVWKKKVSLRIKEIWSVNAGLFSETMEHSGASYMNQDYWIWSGDCAWFLWWQQEGFLGFMAPSDKTSWANICRGLGWGLSPIWCGKGVFACTWMLA